MVTTNVNELPWFQDALEESRKVVLATPVSAWPSVLRDNPELVYGVTS